MAVIIMCEESQAVAKAIRELGYEAFSCDLQDCSGGHPEWHIIGDAINVVRQRRWDGVISSPPHALIYHALEVVITQRKDLVESRRRQ